MEKEVVGAIVAGIGLLGLLYFAHTSRFASSGSLGTVLGLLSIPMGIALLWRLALTAGWWTILIFLVTSFFVGFTSGNFIRKNGIEPLIDLQPLQGGVALVCALTSWFLR